MIKIGVHLRTLSEN